MGKCGRGWKTAKQRREHPMPNRQHQKSHSMERCPSVSGKRKLSWWGDARKWSLKHTLLLTSPTYPSFYMFPDLRHGKPDTDFRENRYRLEVFQQSSQRTWKWTTLILREGKRSVICNYSESPIRRLFCEQKDGYQGQLLLWHGTGNTAKPLARMTALVLWELLQPLRYQPTLGVLSCALHADGKRAQASWQPFFHHMALADCFQDSFEAGYVCHVQILGCFLPPPNTHFLF